MLREKLDCLLIRHQAVSFAVAIVIAPALVLAAVCLATAVVALPAAWLMGWPL